MDLTISLDEIWNGCLQQKRRSQEQLYKQFYRSMMAVCIQYTMNEQDAVEVLNLAFYKVFTRAKSYDSSKGALYTWIRKIVIRSCLDHLASRQHLYNTKQIETDNAISIDADILHKLNAEEILNLLRRLPPATKAVFNLYAIEGYDHNEIAHLLNISAGTSRWHLCEAKRLLQNWIKQTA